MRADFHYDLQKSSFFLEKVGGADTLNEFKEKVTQEKAASCPFCGGAAVAEIARTLSCVAVFVRCESCKAQTRTYLTGTTIDGKKYSIIDAFNNALSDWNRRTAPLD